MSERNRKRALDGPKTAAKHKAIKDATSLLKQQYEGQQKERQPGRNSPVAYATDQVEDAGRGGAVFAAKAMRQMAKRAQNKGREGPEATSSPASSPVSQARPELQSPHRDGTGTQPDPVKRGQEHFLQKRREQQVSNNRLGQSSPIGGDTPHLSDTPHNSPYRSHGSYPQSSVSTHGGKPQGHAPRDFSSQERGEKRAIQGTKKSRQKVQDFTEKKMFHPGRGKVDSGSFFKRPSTGIKKGKTIPGQGNVPVSIHKTATQRAKQMVQRKAQRKLLAQTVAKAKPVAKAGGHLLVRAVVVVGRAAASAVGSIVAAGGGVMFLMMLLLVVAIGGLAASPFGILLSGENRTPDTVPVSAAVAQVQYDFNGQLETLQSGDSYNNVIIHGSTPDWVDVLAVFAVKVAGSNSPDATDVVSIDPARIEKIKAVFWDMCAISHHVEVIDHPDSNPGDGVDDS